MHRYDPANRFYPKHDPARRRVPEIPAPGKRLRVIIDTDAGCEIDDQYAIALALLYPERFDIVGFTAEHWGSPDTLDKTVKEVETVLEKAGQAGKYPVRRGSDALKWFDYPEPSEAVDFIIDRAMACDDDDPLYIIAIGVPTNVASAYMIEPKIAEKIVMVYHTRSQWPIRGANGNILLDLNAARQIFASNIPLVMFDTGSYIRCPKEKSERIIKPFGPLGGYLHEIRVNSPREGQRADTKGFFDIGDIAFLIDPSIAEWDVETAPALSRDSTFDFSDPQGRVLRVYHCGREGCFDLLHKGLAKRFPQT